MQANVDFDDLCESILVIHMSIRNCYSNFFITVAEVVLCPSDVSFTEGRQNPWSFLPADSCGLGTEMQISFPSADNKGNSRRWESPEG